MSVQRVTSQVLPAQVGPCAFALEPVAAGEWLVAWCRFIADEKQLSALSTLQQKHSIQVEEGLYLVSTRLDEPAGYINHSCNPNAGCAVRSP
jgi:hypothetical protein